MVLSLRESFKKETLLTNIGPWASVDTAAWPIAIPNHCTRLPSVVSRASGLLSIVATRVEKHVASRVAPALLPSQTCFFLVAIGRTASNAMLLKTCAFILTKTQSADHVSNSEVRSSTSKIEDIRLDKSSLCSTRASLSLSSSSHCSRNRGA
jgi:hypothetical protein